VTSITASGSGILLSQTLLTLTSLVVSARLRGAKIDIHFILTSFFRKKFKKVFTLKTNPETSPAFAPNACIHSLFNV
jgi:hypothetical protein